LKKLIFLICLFSVSFGFSQIKSKTVYVKYIQEPIKVDAVLDELAWGLAEPATNFWQWFPTDSLQSKQQAEIKMLFDDNNLYIGIKVNSPGNDYNIHSFRRDFGARANDNITLMFDTFNDGTNAFLIGSNAYGVQRDMLLSGGGNDVNGFNMAWDTKWLCEAAIHENYYILEWAIPLSAFKYTDGETQWRFNCYHFDSRENENNTWINIPQNQWIFNLAYMGDMIFERPLGRSKTPISVIPYINTIVSKDFETDDPDNKFRVGGDAKISIGNSMNLDLTVNPDFSQVEVDEQVINLTRFEVSLPEQRQFFIDNSDLFSDFGDSFDANPFFSRRIGIATDLDDNNIENDILGGIRLSGKLSNDLRLGVLNVQTDEDIANEIPATNNAVLAIQQKMFSRSNLSVMFINKQTTRDYDFLAPEDNYNRVLGIDYKLASKDNTWVGNYYFHKSFSPEASNKDISAGAITQYFSRKWNLRFKGLFVGENFRSDLGFIRRTDIYKSYVEVKRIFWPKKGGLNKHSFSIFPIFIWRPTLNFENSDYTIMTQWEAEFNNTAELEVEMNNRYTRLYEEFDPTDTDGAVPLPANEDYYFSDVQVSYRSDLRKTFSYSIEPSIGSFYNGDKFSVKGTMTWRLQPYFRTSIQINYDNINLPDPYPDARIWLVGQRFNLTFNKNVFWDTFIQYSNQENNFGINTRLQWRFAPLSDLFIVYNDNYFTDSVFAPRVRSFNVKLTYWLNL